MDTRHTDPAAPLSAQEFTACVDRCVRAFLADEATASAAGSAPADAAETRLAGWLRRGAVLTDGRAVDTALFDAAILDIEERLPSRGRAERARLLGAARRLAEAVYAQAATQRVLPAT